MQLKTQETDLDAEHATSIKDPTRSTFSCLLGQTQQCSRVHIWNRSETEPSGVFKGATKQDEGGSSYFTMLQTLWATRNQQTNPCDRDALVGAGQDL